MFKRRKWLASLGIGLLITVLLASGCGASAVPAQAAAGESQQATSTETETTKQNAEAAQEKVTVWYFDKVSMNIAKARFEKAYPDVKVNFVLQPFGDMAKKYQAALAAKSGVPDVIGLDTSMVGKFLAAGEDLAAAPYNAKQYEKDFVAWKFEAPVTKDGQMPAFPWDVATGVMFYRPDVFEAAGLPTDPAAVSKALATWEDFIAAGKKMAETSGGKQFIAANAHEVYNAGFWQNGGNLVTGDEITFPVEGLQPLETAVKAEQANISAKIPTWSERWAPALKSGKVATIFSGAWMLGNLETWIDANGAGKWRVAEAPGGAFNNGGTYLQIPKLAKNKAAAWDFVRFVTTNADVQNAIFKETGIVPAYMPAWKSPIYDEPVAYLGGQKAWRLMVDLAQQVKPLHYSPVDALATDLMNAKVDAAILGKSTPADALAAAAKDVQERSLRASNLKLTIAK